MGIATHQAVIGIVRFSQAKPNWPRFAWWTLGVGQAAITQVLAYSFLSNDPEMNARKLLAGLSCVALAAAVFVLTERQLQLPAEINRRWWKQGAIAVLASTDGIIDFSPMSGATPNEMREDARVVQRGATGAGEAWLWWRTVPSWPNEKLGVIGQFTADNWVTTQKILGEAEEKLRAAGCTLAVGPMNGNTWRSYRFVTEPSDAPPFFLEPAHPPSWPSWWEHCGFAPLAHYYSTITDDLSQRDVRVAVAASRLQSVGVQFDRSTWPVTTKSWSAFLPFRSCRSKKTSSTRRCRKRNSSDNFTRCANAFGRSSF